MVVGQQTICFLCDNHFSWPCSFSKHMCAILASQRFILQPTLDHSFTYRFEITHRKIWGI